MRNYRDIGTAGPTSLDTASGRAEFVRLSMMVGRLALLLRFGTACDGAELEGAEEPTRGFLMMIAEGDGSRTVGEEFRKLEAQEDNIRARLAAGPIDTLDIQPTLEIYRRTANR